jgi:hypothetical protein
MAFMKKYVKQELDKIAALQESRRLMEIQKELDKIALAKQKHGADPSMVNDAKYLKDVLERIEDTEQDRIYRLDRIGRIEQLK